MGKVIADLASSAASATFNVENATSSVDYVISGTDGSANQFLKTDGSGNLSWVADSGGLFSAYAIFVDQKSQNTDGGTFTSGAWRQRDLNTTLANTDTTNITLGTNEFTLLTGTYLIEWFPTAGGVTERTQSALHDGTSNVALGNSTYKYIDSGLASHGSARITVSGTKTFTIQHQCESTISGYGFGEGSNFDTEQYTMVKIFKEA